MENDDVLIEYILGGLSEAERERLEEQYFIHDETWEKLRAVENDLIDSYVRGELPPHRREQFEKYFLALPGRRQRLEFARTLIDPVLRETAAEEVGKQGKRPEQSLWNWRWAATAAGLILAATVTLLVIQNIGLRRQLSELRSDEIGLQNQVQALSRQIANAQQSHNSGTDATNLFSSKLPTVSLMLMPGLLRNGNNVQEQILPVPSAPSEVLLFLSLQSDEYSKYDVVLRTAEGKEIRRLEGLTSQILKDDKVVALRLSAQLFVPGDYIATLFGKTAKGKAQTIDAYTFSVRR